MLGRLWQDHQRPVPQACCLLPLTSRWVCRLLKKAALNACMDCGRQPQRGLPTAPGCGGAASLGKQQGAVRRWLAPLCPGPTGSCAAQAVTACCGTWLRWQGSVVM